MVIASTSAVTRLAPPVGFLPPAAVVFGRSEVMRALRTTLEKGAHANVPVLLQGESGTGKDLLARMIHDMSPWRLGPFVKIACRALAPGRLERELLEAQMGAAPVGDAALNSVCRGTVFLDEISELDAAAQSKLLDLLQDGQGQEEAGAEDGALQARLVSATSRPLEEEVSKGRFRQNLFYRINVISVRVPALRERSDDIPALVNHFFALFSERYKTRPKRISDQVLALLMGHSWPGNIRELENVVKRYVILGSEDAIYGELRPVTNHSFVSPRPATDRPISLKEITRAAVRDVERQVILEVLQANNWNRRRAARALNISYRALLYKMKDVALGVSPNSGPTEGVVNK
jgi:two-component system response regulator AtoC